MALAAIDQNIISEEMQLGEEFIAILDKARNLRARFDLNGTYDRLDDNGGADVTAVFPHLNQSKIGNGFSLLSTILAAAGDMDDFYMLKG